MNAATVLTVHRKLTLEERKSILHQMYAQVLERQPYSHERRTLAKAEKDFLADKIGVRRFLKELGHSNVYLNTFYFSASNLKFIERSFKHFMGRAPRDQAEMREYCDLLLRHGPHKMITALLDSEEYRKTFGCYGVPGARQLPFHESPRSFWESRVLNQEQLGQRGHVVPTLVWHQLGLNCDAGVCRPQGVAIADHTLAEHDRVNPDQNRPNRGTVAVAEPIAATMPTMRSPSLAARRSPMRPKG
ncbi:phycobilisome rod-core linker polypeptide [Leptolyngbya sp. AN02str]|uniref:phycobilisome rod-core linker polypeptide n=1 Tax=Leptolyngbya sp. AN02str TaxID=3423363 RepID=UPI003D3198B0